MMRDQLLARLEPLGQEHLLAFWEQLDGAARERLARQIDGVDFDLIRRLTEGRQAQEAWAELAAQASPPAAIRLADRTAPRVAEARQRGLEALRPARWA